MKTNVGYARLHRKLRDNPIWTQLPPSVLKVFLHFVLEANWRASKWYDGKDEVELPPGSFATSYAAVAADTALTIKQVRLAFTHLEKLHVAAYSRAQRYTVVTLKNYSRYQPLIEEEGITEGTNKGSKRAGKGHDEGTMRAPVEEYKNINTARSEDTEPLDVSLCVSGFPHFWGIYQLIRAVDPDPCCRMWLSLDCDQRIPEVISCLRSYADSDEVARGVTMNGATWLSKNAVSDWKSRWPKARQPQNREDALMRKFNERMQRHAQSE